MVILDTNIIIDHLRLQEKRESVLLKFVKKYSREELALAMVSLQELYEGTSTRKRRKEQALLAVIAPLRVLPYTYEIAKLAGIIARDLPRPMELADAAIAATAVTNGAKLLTLNKKDFQNIAGLELVG